VVPVILRLPEPLLDVGRLHGLWSSGLLGYRGSAGGLWLDGDEGNASVTKGGHALRHGCRAGPICGARTGFAIPKKIVTP
jgi:hypothetical protein